MPPAFDGSVCLMSVTVYFASFGIAFPTHSRHISATTPKGSNYTAGGSLIFKSMITLWCKVVGVPHEEGLPTFVFLFHLTYIL